MPLELNDEHIEKLSMLIAGYFVDNLYCEKLNIKEFIDKFDESVKIFQGKINSKCGELWNAKLEEEEEDLKKRQFDIDYFLVRGIGKDNAEENIKNLIPEEKLFVNKSIFREKISKINFSNITPEVEKQLSDL